MKEVNNIFFDLDHTLWDFDKNSDLTFFKILKKNNLNIDVSKFLNSYHPINRKYWELYRENKVSKADLRYYRLSDTFKKLNYDINDNLINQLAIDYIEHLSDFNHLIPDTLIVLNSLKSNYRMHIITNGFKEVQYIKLKKSGIYSFFKKIIVSEDVGVLKPNKKIFQYALKICNTTSKEALMIGDDFISDVKGAQSLGIDQVFFDYKHTMKKSDSTFTIFHLKELENILI